MTSSYDVNLVLLSILVAMAASYSALDLAGRVTANSGRAAQQWLLGGALVMGGGIWAMHFIGMLAYELPIKMAYDDGLTLLSMLIAMLTSGFALKWVSGSHLDLSRLLVGGVVMGAGISGMHYTGMAAMQMQPPIQYDPFLFSALGTDRGDRLHRRVMAGIHPALGHLGTHRMGQAQRSDGDGHSHYRYALHRHGGGTDCARRYLHGDGRLEY